MFFEEMDLHAIDHRADMCNLRPAALFGAARGALFMILKWYFKMNHIPFDNSFYIFKRD